MVRISLIYAPLKDNQPVVAHKKGHVKWRSTLIALMQPFGWQSDRRFNKRVTIMLEGYNLVHQWFDGK